MTFLGLIVAAAFGGAGRFLVEYYLPPVGSSAFPRATLIVNVVGAFILGLLVSAPHDLRIIFGTGLCGALTTFSGVSLQIHRRVIASSFKAAGTYTLVMISAGLLAAAIGIDLSSRLFG